MPDAASLFPGDSDSETPNIVSAVVRQAPATLTDGVGVVIPAFDELKLEVIRYWMPRGDVLPAEGDAALVAYADDGEPWLIAFSPSS